MATDQYLRYVSPVNDVGESVLQAMLLPFGGKVVQMFPSEDKALVKFMDDPNEINIPGYTLDDADPSDVNLRFDTPKKLDFVEGYEFKVTGDEENTCEESKVTDAPNFGNSMEPDSPKPQTNRVPIDQFDLFYRITDPYVVVPCACLWLVAYSLFYVTFH